MDLVTPFVSAVYAELDKIAATIGEMHADNQRRQRKKPGMVIDAGKRRSPPPRPAQVAIPGGRWKRPAYGREVPEAELREKARAEAAARRAQAAESQHSPPPKATHTRTRVGPSRLPAVRKPDAYEEWGKAVGKVINKGKYVAIPAAALAVAKKSRTPKVKPLPAIKPKGLRGPAAAAALAAGLTAAGVASARS